MPKFTIRPIRAAISGSGVVTAPPSPIAKGFVAWKEKTSVSPWVPSGIASSSIAPKPGAESISSGALWRAAMSRQAARRRPSGAVPNGAQARIPATRPRRTVSAASSDSGSRQ